MTWKYHSVYLRLVSHYIDFNFQVCKCTLGQDRGRETRTETGRERDDEVFHDETLQSLTDPQDVPKSGYFFEVCVAAVVM